MVDTISTPAQNAAVDAVVGLINAGTGDNGQLVIETSGGTTLVAIDFADPAYGSAANGTATATLPASQHDVVATGTAAQYKQIDKDGATVISGSVTQRHAITAVNQGNRQFTVSGDQTADIEVAQRIRVTDSTGNDGTYTVEAFEESAGDTIVTVKESISDTTADGFLRLSGVTLSNLSLESGEKIELSEVTHSQPASV